MFREDAVAIYHTHSPLAVVASLGAGQSFSASRLQMVKAMRGHKWSDTLQVNITPISTYYHDHDPSAANHREPGQRGGHRRPAGGGGGGLAGGGRGAHQGARPLRVGTMLEVCQGGGRVGA